MSNQNRTQQDVERASEIAGLDLAHRTDGQAAGAILAASIGMFVLGVLTVWNEASESMHDWLESWEWGQGVGPLAGKTTVSVIVWAIAWIVLAVALRDREVDLRKWFWVSLVLGALGFLGTFPLFFRAFAAE
jgi:hypothetical protein